MMRPSRPTIERTGSPSSRHQMTSVVSPNVQIIAMPEPFSGSASSCATTGTSTSNSGERTVRAEQGLVARVVGMGDEGDARGEQLGSRRLDVDRFAVVGAAEADAVVRARPLAILELGLRDRRPEVDVPQRRRLGEVGVTVAQQPQERSLRGAPAFAPIVV